mmetsp:Transcript_22875/g.63518  ORF Transcript_22875/g.63518 Transcript_22875/m.63518 type:complete len:238 (-) Transcript_22875:271-984(-)
MGGSRGPVLSLLHSVCGHGARRSWRPLPHSLGRAGGGGGGSGQLSVEVARGGAGQEAVVMAVLLLLKRVVPLVSGRGLVEAIAPVGGPAGLGRGPPHCWLEVVLGGPPRGRRGRRGAAATAAARHYLAAAGRRVVAATTAGSDVADVGRTLVCRRGSARRLGAQLERPPQAVVRALPRARQAETTGGSLAREPAAAIAVGEPGLRALRRGALICRHWNRGRRGRLLCVGVSSERTGP